MATATEEIPPRLPADLSVSVSGCLSSAVEVSSALPLRQRKRKSPTRIIIAIVASSGRLAFDSLVQRDAPDANRGRSFARFELRFQSVWVVGAVIPVLVTIPLRIGFLIVAGVAGFALFSYIAGQKAARRAHVNRPPIGPGIPPNSEVPAEAATRDVGTPADEVRPYPPPVGPSPFG